jgi:hypothetical protein
LNRGCWSSSLGLTTRILPPPSQPPFSSGYKLLLHDVYISFPPLRLRRHCATSISSHLVTPTCSVYIASSALTNLLAIAPYLPSHTCMVKNLAFTGLSHTSCMFTRTSFLTPLAGIYGALGILRSLRRFHCHKGWRFVFDSAFGLSSGFCHLDSGFGCWV